MEKQTLKGRPVYTPPVDVYESDSEYLLIMDLPGVTQDKLKINLEKGELGIVAEWEESEDGLWIRREFGSSTAMRDFRLPDNINEEGIEAKLEHGVLSISIKKVEPPQPKTIPIIVG